MRDTFYVAFEKPHPVQVGGRVAMLNHSPVTGIEHYTAKSAAGELQRLQADSEESMSVRMVRVFQ